VERAAWLNFGSPHAAPTSLSKGTVPLKAPHRDCKEYIAHLSTEEPVSGAAVLMALGNRRDFADACRNLCRDLTY
jgi:hypothetical protein